MAECAGGGNNVSLIDQLVFQERVLVAANHAFSRARTLFGNEKGWEDRPGAYFCLADGHTGMPILIAKLGEPDPAKAEKYLAFCQEKVKRLAQNPAHLTSYESRNPGEDQWGGAIRANDDSLLSLSGQPELGDEGIVMTIAEALDMTNVERLAEMVSRGNQAYWQRLRHGLS